MSLRILKRARDERGAAMVEFALLAPVLLLIVFGILYFGRFVGYTNDETHLAEEAARYAAVSQMPSNCNSNLATCIQQEAPGELQSGSGDVPSPAKVCIALAPGATGVPGDSVVATVTAQFHLIPLLNFALPAATEMATMRLEQTPVGGIIGCSP